MKKLFTFLGIFLLLAVLAGCTTGGDTVVTPPSFVGVSIDETNPYNGTEYELYYKEKNESTLVGVVLNNPDNLNIRAIIINGYSYRYNTFLDEGDFVSTTNNIYFYMSAGETIGLTEYSVNDIEYFDGSDTKDVLVQNNNEFHLFVYKGLPSVVRENYSLTQDSITVDFDVTDDDGVIIPSSLVAKIYLGNEEIVSLEETLDVGFNSVEFDTSIMSDTDYEIRIYANYDIDDTTGLHQDVILWYGNFTTLPTLIPNALIENVMVSSNSVTFDIVYNDIDGVTVPGASRVAVFDGDTEITSFGINGSVTGVAFSDLLNSKQYSLKVIANYDLRDGDGVRTDYVLSQSEFETTARAVPVPEIENIRVEENRILFDLIIEDDPLDPIIVISTLYANVYVDGVLAETVQISGSAVELQINDVLSGKDVRVEFLATYDLNDGNGPQTDQVIGVFERVSLLNSPPEVDVRNIEVTQGYINLDLAVYDNSNTLLGSVRAVLYSVEEVDGVDIETYIDTQFLSLEGTTATFTHLVRADMNYRIKMIADYNLLDGAGNKNNQILFVQEITSLQPKAPAAEIQDPIISNSGLEFDVVVMDADETVVMDSLFIYIYKDGVLQDLLTQPLVVGLNHIVYTGLSSDYQYNFEIEANYDVLDGSGLQENKVLLSQSLSTVAKELPTASIGTIDSTTESLTFDVSVLDVDNVLETGTIYAVLYYNNGATGYVQPLVVGDNPAVSFIGINSNTPYEVRIIADYDLDNGEGIVTEYKMTDFVYLTEAKLDPVVSIENIEATTDTITFDVELTDEDAVLTGTARAVLFIGETDTGQSIDLSVGINSNVQFTGVYSNQSYIIYVVADYDLNDTINVLTDEIIAYSYAETYFNEMVTGMLEFTNVAIESITFNAYIYDTSGVVTTDLRAYLIEDGVATGDYIDLVVGENIAVSFINLNSDSLYTVELRTNYNLGDMVGEQVAFLASLSTATSAYEVPGAYIEELNETFDSVVFDVLVIDSSNTSTGDYKAVLYYNDLPTGQEIILLEGNNVLQSFDTLYSGVEYEIKIESVYDLRDGEGVHTEPILTYDFFTVSKTVPTGFTTNFVPLEDQVYFEFDYIDEDNTLIPGTFVATLYDEDLNPIDSILLTDTTVYFDLSYMLSDYAFTIRITSDYDLSNGPDIVEDGIILSVNLTTYANQVPSVLITNTEINQNDVTFHLNVTDPDEVVDGDLVVEIYDSLNVFLGTVTVPLQYSEEFGNYYDDEVTVPGVTLIEGVWNNITIIADYNLRDGDGLQSAMIIGEQAIIAANKIIPQAHVYDVVLGTNTIQFDVMVYDNRETYIGNAQAILYLNGIAVGVPIPLTVGFNDDILFNVPTSDADYELVVSLDYDNSPDGDETVHGYEVANEIYHTVAKVLPEASGVLDTATVDQAILDITVIDPDSVIIPGSIVAILYRDGVQIGLPIPLVDGVNEDVLFDGLLSDNSYEARIYVDYDLGDGVTVLLDQPNGSVVFATIAKEDPTAVISNITTDKNSITFDLNITDVDSVLTGDIEVLLYKNGSQYGLPLTVPALTNIGLQFTGLDSDSSYRLDVVVNYDLTNGLPAYVGETLTDATTYTYANEEATAEITVTETTHNTLTFNATVTDVDGVIDGDVKAILLYNGVPTGQEFVLSLPSNTGLIFTGLYSLKTYEVQVVADIDMLDGSPQDANSILAISDPDFSRTTETLEPAAELSNYVLRNDEIQFDVNITDDYGTMGLNLRAELFLVDATTGLEVDTGLIQPLVAGENLAVSFTGLEYGATYVVKILGDYNDNSDTVTLLDEVIHEEEITTVPLMEITDVVNEIFEVNLKVNLNDQFSILDDEVLTLELYEFDELTEAFIFIGTYYTDGTSTIDVMNLFNDNLYRVKVYANVTVLGSTLVYDQELAVPERVLQTIEWSPIDVTGSTIATNVTITLPDDVNNVIVGDVDAVLYSIIGGVVTEVARIETLTDGINNLVFNFDGTSGITYMVKIEGTCNFNDGLGDQLDYVISARTIVYRP